MTGVWVIKQGNRSRSSGRTRKDLERTRRLTILLAVVPQHFGGIDRIQRLGQSRLASICVDGFDVTSDARGVISTMQISARDQGGLTG